MLRLETKKKLFTFYIIVSILLTITTYLYLELSYYKYHLDVKKRYILDHEVLLKIYFEDLDNDGESERFELQYLKDINRNLLLCYNSDDIMLEQFYIEGAVRKEGIHFNDWDEDGNKDILVLNVKNDSLYFDVIDLIGRKFLVKNAFVSIKDERNNSKEWFYNSFLIFDNSNNRKLLYLSIATAYGIYPRSVFVIDREKLRVLHRFDSTAPIRNAYLVDINSDSQNELVALSTATGNDFIQKGYHDFSSWLFIFNDSLKFSKEPIDYNRYPGQSQMYKLDGNENDFLLFSNEINLPRVFSKLEIYNSSFVLQKSVLLNENILYPAVDSLTGKIFTSTREGLMTVYDYDLKVIKEEQIQFNRPNIVRKISKADIDSDDGFELLVFVDKEIRVYNQELKMLTRIESDYLPKELNDDELVKSYKSEFGNALIIPTDTSLWVYVLVNNFFISNLHFIVPLIGLLYFLFLLMLGKAIAFVFGYISVFNYFVKISDQGIMLLSHTGKIKKVNESLIDLLMLNETNYLGKDYQNIFSNLEEVSSQIKNSIKNLENSENDLSFRREEKYFNGKIRVKVFQTFFNFPYLYLIEVIDFSKSLLEDRYKVWSRTSQKIAHDIKTPLSTIMLNLKSIQYRIDKEDLINKEIYNEDLTMIQNELDRIKNLTKNFLKFTNSEKPNFTSVDAEKILMKSLNQFESYFDSHIELKIDQKEKCVLNADENQIEQLFHILIENSIDAVVGQGYIRISIEQITDLSSDKNCCLIEITDNGEGIPKDRIDKIFEPYFTTKVDGTGMGLAIGKKIVDDHNGTIEFYSHNNLGTTVKLIFPLG